MFNKEELKPGIKVKLKNKRGSTWADGGSMDKYIGAIVTIERIERIGGRNFSIKESAVTWEFNIEDIDSIVESAPMSEENELEELMKHFKANYPIGTIYCPAHIQGEKSIVHTHEARIINGNLFAINGTLDGNKDKNGHNFGELIARKIGENWEWATIIELPKMETPKVDISLYSSWIGKEVEIIRAPTQEDWGQMASITEEQYLRDGAKATIIREQYEKDKLYVQAGRHNYWWPITCLKLKEDEKFQKPMTISESTSFKFNIGDTVVSKEGGHYYCDPEAFYNCKYEINGENYRSYSQYHRNPIKIKNRKTVKGINWYNLVGYNNWHTEEGLKEYTESKIAKAPELPIDTSPRKFKAGDIIIGNEKSSQKYNITIKGWKGEFKGYDAPGIIKVIELGERKQEFHLDENYFDLYDTTSAFYDRDLYVGHPESGKEKIKDLEFQTPIILPKKKKVEIFCINDGF